MLIKELTILTNNLISTEDFYSNILELTILNKSENIISFSVGHTILSFSYTTGSTPFYHFAFSIPSNRVEEAHAFINARTDILPFTPGTTIANFSNWNAHAFYFHDTQNNIVEFIAHHDLPNSSHNPFTSSSIIGVCEIGVPVNDVADACKELNEKYNVPYYLKGPHLTEFAVMGDDYGLFIVTKIGRGWLPTQAPAETHFTELVFEIDDELKKFVVDANR
jgi:hypothetical protein